VLERANGPTGRRQPWHDPRSTPYEILGVETDASPAAMRRAYLKLMQIWHPDRFPRGSALNQEAQFATTCINEAYWRLRPAKRPRSGRFHRTPRSPWTSREAQDEARPTRAGIGSSDWDEQRVLSTGLVVLLTIAWLAASASIFWVLIVQY
jgi:hypothetical protein